MLMEREVGDNLQGLKNLGGVFSKNCEINLK